MTDTETGTVAEVTVGVTADGAKTAVVLTPMVAAVVPDMVAALKAAVVEDVETVVDDALDADPVVVDAEPVAAHTIMVEITTPITTTTKSSATDTGNCTAECMGIAPINPINETLPPMVTKVKQRSQI